MPLYPLPWQDPQSRMGQERKTVLGWLGARLRSAQDHLAELRKHDSNGLLPGAEAVVADMLTLKAELETDGYKYTLPEHLQPRYDENFAPKENAAEISKSGQKGEVAPDD